MGSGHRRDSPAPLRAVTGSPSLPEGGRARATEQSETRAVSISRKFPRSAGLPPPRHAPDTPCCPLPCGVCPEWMTQPRPIHAALHGQQRQDVVPAGRAWPRRHPGFRALPRSTPSPFSPQEDRPGGLPLRDPRSPLCGGALRRPSRGQQPGKDPECELPVSVANTPLGLPLPSWHRAFSWGDSARRVAGSGLTPPVHRLQPPGHLPHCPCLGTRPDNHTPQKAKASPADSCCGAH